MITVNNRDPRPIYEQVKEGFKRLIITGALAPDERLPSVRELATNLAIDPNTIQRAYRELEAEGWCYTVPGKGSFAEARREPDRKKISELLEVLENTVAELRFLGASEEEIRRCLLSAGSAKEVSES